MGNIRNINVFGRECQHAVLFIYFYGVTNFKVGQFQFSSECQREKRIFFPFIVYYVASAYTIQ